MEMKYNQYQGTVEEFKEWFLEGKGEESTTAIDHSTSINVAQRRVNTANQLVS